ncbi:MAG: tRNA lysidine(34) synthetase TilS [Xanthomonadales bacterium]|nr:tRNA lysidine(34) synthetase TilS [Xanthomonadales bacterium]MBK7146768.1 tRNA lysidine(34) synthetase TilS [Xanthomonadales bacterium]
MSAARRILADFIATLPHREFVLALSGGMDSRTLLQVAASLRGQLDLSLRAIHVDHGLHPDSARWAERCRDWCTALAVPLDVVRVQVTRIAELGLEAAARAARHAAFAERLGDDEVLLAAHHRDDQAETMLLRALRAPGYDGLAGMRPLRRFSRGWLARPWLEVPRSAIRAEAEREGLEWIEDPSNADTTLDRNFLRHEILPRLSARWPQAMAALATTAQRAADLLALAEPEVQRLLAQHRDLETGVLDARVLELSAGTAIAVLKAWLRERALTHPPAAVLREVLRQMRDARADRVPEVRWADAVLRRYRGQLHAQTATSSLPLTDTDWLPEQPFALTDGGVLPALPGMFEAPLRVAPRRGGEKIRVHAQAPRRPLRLLLQECGVPPWQRAQLPCLWQGETLIAVGDRFLDAGFAARLRDAGHVWRVESAAKPG